MSFTLGYDNLSQVTSLAQSYPTVGGSGNPGTGAWAYTYTQSGELATAQLGSGPVNAYSYDGAGDRTSVKVGAGAPVVSTFDMAGRQTSNGPAAYTFNGND